MSHLQEEIVRKIPLTHSDRVPRNRSTIKLPQRYEANIIEFEKPTTYEEAISG